MSFQFQFCLSHKPTSAEHGRDTTLHSDIAMVLAAGWPNAQRSKPGNQICQVVDSMWKCQENVNS